MDELNEDDADKYNQIRQIASRNWLKPASVSLAKLDQVKAKVYNIGLTDQQNLKTRGINGPNKGVIKVAEAGLGQESDGSHGLDMDPPLSRLTLQHSAWGSNTSIPDMIRQQSERQRARVGQPNKRPESAKIARPGRPPSGRKPRPQSAKDPVPATETKIGVRGAHYDPQSRPEGLDVHAGGSCWVASPAGDYIEKSIAHVADGQVPSAPRTSPDFIRMLEAHNSMPDVDGDGVSGLVSGLLGESKGQRSRTPPPIHLALPQVDQDEDDELELLGLDEDFSGGSMPALFHDFSKLSEKQKHKKASVYINESENTTRDITPRQKRRPSGKHKVLRGDQLRHVKSRIDSGLQLYGKPKAAATQESESAVQETGRENAENDTSSVKKAQPKLSTITVAYLEVDEDDGSCIEGKTRRRKKKKASDIETMMSRLEMEEEESSRNEQPDSDLERPCSRISTIPSSKNFYSVAMHSGKEKIKTVTTLQLGQDSERQLVESKVTSAIDPMCKSRVEYQAPRPRSAIRSKSEPPKVLDSEPHASLKEKKHEPGEKMGRTNRSKTATTTTSEPPSQSDITIESHKTTDVTISDITTIEPDSKVTTDITASDFKPDKTSDEVEKSASPCDIATAVSMYITSNDETTRQASCGCSRPLSAGHNQPHTQTAITRKPRAKTATTRSRSTSAKAKSKKTNPPIEIWTRRDNYEADTEGLKECREMQDRLIDAGVPVSMETLTRALLPPSGYGYEGGNVKTELHPRLNKNYSSGLLSKPQLWLAEEYKRVQSAKRKVREATRRLMEQQNEASYEKSERNKKGKKGKKKSNGTSPVTA